MEVYVTYAKYISESMFLCYVTSYQGITLCKISARVHKLILKLLLVSFITCKGHIILSASV